MFKEQTGCCLWCKDTNFNANHNTPEFAELKNKVVVYGAKILILMQITTNPSGIINMSTLLFMVQRY